MKFKSMGASQGPNPCTRYKRIILIVSPQILQPPYKRTISYKAGVGPLHVPAEKQIGALISSCVVSLNPKGNNGKTMNPFISSKHFKKKPIIYFSLRHCGTTNLLRKGLGLGLSQPRSARTIAADSIYQAPVIVHQYSGSQANTLNII